MSIDDELRDLKERVHRQRAELAALASRIEQLESARSEPHAGGAAPTPFVSGITTPLPPPIVEAINTSTISLSETGPANRWGVATRRDERVSEWRPESSPEESADGVELRIGKTWMNRIGAIILLLGVGFFVKYSFDQGWISPLMRVCLSASTGLVLILAGEWALTRGMRQFAVGVLGAGSAILYLSTFAAYYFYHLVGVQTDFLLMSAVTALSTIIAVHANVPAIAVLALVGGFWTPLALSTGENRQIALLTYVLILDVGYLLTGVIRRWDIMRLLSWIGTASLFGGWYLRFYEAGALWPTLGFVLAFYVLFQIEMLWSLGRQRVGRAVYFRLMHVNTAVFFAAVYFLGRVELDRWMGAICIATAALQFIFCGLLRARGEAAKPSRDALLLDGLALLALFAPLQFDRQLVPMAWCAQSVICFWFCRNTDLPWLRAKAGGVLLAAFCHLMFFDYFNARLTTHLFAIGQFHFSWIIALFVGLGLAAYAGAFCLSYGRAIVETNDHELAWGLLIFGSAVLLGIFAAQYERYHATWCWLFVAAIWYAIGLRSLSGGTIALLMILAVGCKYLIFDTAAAVVTDQWKQLHGLGTNRAVGTGLLAIVAAWSGRFYYQRLMSRVPHASKLNDFLGADSLAPLFGVLAAVLVIWTGTFEIMRTFRYEALRLRFTDPTLAMHTILSVFWGLTAITMLVIGFVRLFTELRYLAIGLFGVTIIKVFLVDLSNLKMVYRIVSFIALGLLLLGASYLYQKLSSRLLSKSVKDSVPQGI